jgi:large subunit ribosomal protein L24
MLLPVQEYNRKMRELRRERGKPELSEEMLEKIGEVIVRNRLVRAAGGATAEAEVNKVQKAVEELSLGGDAPAATGGEQQPRA